MRIIGIMINGRECRFINSIVSKSVLSLLLLVCGSCGVFCPEKHNSYYYYYDNELRIKVYTWVEEEPMYNGKNWKQGLTEEFNRMFEYKYGEDEPLRTNISAELIINKKGKLLRIRVQNNPETSYNQAVWQFLSTCDKWTPGRINDKTVNTRVIWSLVYPLFLSFHGFRRIC